jgi:hypothetical protein
VLGAVSAGSSASGAGAALIFVVLFIVYGVVVVGSIALLIVALIDIARRPDWQWKIAGQEKILWILLVLLLNFLAVPSLIYWFNIRKKLIAVQQAAAAGQYGPGHMTYGGWEPGPALYGPVMVPPAWQPDPSDQSRWRWWDGQQWTDHVSDGVSGGPTVTPGAPVPAPGTPPAGTTPDR